MEKNSYDFLEALGQRESSGNYKAKNKLGYIGKYQMGETAMIDAGYYKKSSGNYNNDWSGEFTGKDGVYSVEDFLNNPAAQENAQNIYKKLQWGYLKNDGAAKYLGQNIGGITITQSALLGGAHLGGQGHVINYLRSGGKDDFKDDNGVHISEYMREFQDYDVSDIINNTYDPLKPLKLDTEPKKEPNSIQYGKVEKNIFKNWFNKTDTTDPKRVYTFEEVGMMKPEEFRPQQDRILSDFVNRKMIHDYEAMEKLQSGELIYVQPYQRSDGTEVKGYYRRK